MVTRNGNNVKLIDFGLADTDSYAILKQPAGTRKYMAPEQLSSSMTDIRNDIYSIGVIIDEMNLGWPYGNVARHCVLPTNKRYANVGEVRKAISRKRNTTNTFLAVALLCMIVGLGYRYVEYMKERALIPYDFVDKDNKGDPLYYRFINDGKEVELTCKVVGTENSDTYSGAIIVPPEVEYRGKKYPVTSVSDKAFYFCCNMGDLQLPETVTRIGEWAFSWCTSLTNVSMSDSVKYIGTHAFSRCYGLMQIDIPVSIDTITACCYDNDTSMRRVKFPPNLQYIDSLAFANLDMSSIEFPNSLKGIGYMAFGACELGDSLNLPEGLEYIGESCFNHNGMKTLTLPSTLVTVEHFAFRACEKLRNIICKMTVPPAIPDDVFTFYEPGFVTIEPRDFPEDLVYKNAVLYVPKGTKNLYKKTNGWKRFENIEEF